jgi:two-component system phosphate regulon sensor histidine kinase PhoR
LKKKSIAIIIGLMGFALLGVVAMQLYFLKQSYDMQSKLFDRSVNEALDNVVAKLTKQDAVNFLNGKAEKSDVKEKQFTDAYGNFNQPAKHFAKVKKRQTALQRRLALIRDSLMMNQKLDEMVESGRFQLRIDEFTDEFGTVHGRITPQIVNNGINHILKPHGKLHKYDTLSYIYSDPQFGNQVITYTHVNPLWQQEHDRKLKEKQFRMVKKMLENDSIKYAGNTSGTVIQNLAEEYQKSNEPLRARINPLWIDSLLRFELHNKGIYLPFSYEVTTANSDSLLFSKAMDMNGEKPVFIPANTYQTSIFSTEVINDPGIIRLSFPQKSSLILGTMTVAMGTTAGLLFILVLCFGYTLFSIIRQKKIAEMKADFINNMTHEFKTPVSTIMIASEALKDNEIVSDKNRISRLANIIYEENERLGSHIERVLNIARIDNNDFKLEKKPVDINEMISLVLDSMALKLQKCNAAVTLNLDAHNGVIKADELHFSNLLYNLIDNAIKYSQGTPQINISTVNKNNQVIIRVADKGIGMSRDQQTKIFEQFYRIPTGNLHDVKGFGLGLSYVNTIVKRLNGTIGVKSEKDKGSEFELKFSVE